MTITELLKGPSITCHVNDTLERAARLMWDRDVGAIIVVREDGKIAGVITDRDICMSTFMQGRPPADVLVHAAMSDHVVTARIDQRIEDVEAAMSANQLHRIPIVDSESRPVGMISVNDLALEAVRPDSRLAQGRGRVANLVAAINRPRLPGRAAA